MKIIAFKIDVVAKQILPLHIEPTLENYYRELDCHTIDFIYPFDRRLFTKVGASIIVDDEGLLRDTPIGAFSVRGYPTVLSGHGIVVGNGDDGDSISCPLTLDKLKELIRFEDTHYLPEPSITFISE